MSCLHETSRKFYRLCDDCHDDERQGREECVSLFHKIHETKESGGSCTMEQTFMKEKKILPLVLSMSLPMMLSMLVNSLYNIVDSYFVAQISEQAMTALSLVYPLQLLETAIAVGFGVGINAAAAFYLGAGERNNANDVVTSGTLLSIVHGILLTLFSIGSARYFVGMFTDQQPILEDAVKYAWIVFAFTIPNVVAITFEKIFQAEGRMKVSMISMLCGCVVNIILDPMLIFGIGFFPKMGIAGAALATGIGQVIPLIGYIIIFIKRPMAFQMTWHKNLIRKRLCRQMYGVGIPATLNLALPSFMITALNGILAVYSQTYVLVLGIYYKLQTFIYLSANGIVQGIRPIISYNYGAGESARVRRIFRTSLVMIAAIMAAGMGICLGFSKNLMGLFTTNAQTIAEGAAAIRIICMGFVISSLSVTVSGMLEALGKGGQSLVISLLRYIIVIIPAAYLIGKIWGGQAIWNCFWIAEATASAVAFVLYKRLRY